MYFSRILPVFEEQLYQETPFFCVLLAESQFAPRLLPPFLSLLCFPTKNTRDRPLTTYRKYAKMHCVKNKLQALKENSLKGFLQKSGGTYFLVLTNRLKSNFKKKGSISLYGVGNAFLPETTTFKERFPKLACKSSVS